MGKRSIVIEVAEAAKIKAVAIGGTGKPNTVVDDQVGDVVIRGILVVDDRNSTPDAILPSSVVVEDEDLAEEIRGMAVAHHLGVDDMLEPDSNTPEPDPAVLEESRRRARSLDDELLFGDEER